MATKNPKTSENSENRGTGWPKFHAPPHILKQESAMKKIGLNQGQKDEARLAWLDTQIQDLQKKIDKDKVLRGVTLPDEAMSMEMASLIDRRANLQEKIAESGIDAAFTEDFMRWLEGMSEYNVKFREEPVFVNGVKVGIKKRECTPWGNKPLTRLPGVYEFIGSGIDNRHDVVQILTKLKVRLPKDVYEAYIYYKYLVRGYAINGYSLKECTEFEHFHMPGPTGYIKDQNNENGPMIPYTDPRDKEPNSPPENPDYFSEKGGIGYEFSTANRASLKPATPAQIKACKENIEAALRANENPATVDLMYVPFNQYVALEKQYRRREVTIATTGTKDDLKVLTDNLADIEARVDEYDRVIAAIPEDVIDYYAKKIAKARRESENPDAPLYTKDVFTQDDDADFLFGETGRKGRRNTIVFDSLLQRDIDAIGDQFDSEPESEDEHKDESFEDIPEDYSSEDITEFELEHEDKDESSEDMPVPQGISGVKIPVIPNISPNTVLDSPLGNIKQSRIVKPISFGSGTKPKDSFYNDVLELKDRYDTIDYPKHFNKATPTQIAAVLLHSGAITEAMVPETTPKSRKFLKDIETLYENVYNARKEMTNKSKKVLHQFLTDKTKYLQGINSKYNLAQMIQMSPLKNQTDAMNFMLNTILKKTEREKNKSQPGTPDANRLAAVHQALTTPGNNVKVNEVYQSIYDTIHDNFKMSKKDFLAMYYLDIQEAELTKKKGNEGKKLNTQNFSLYWKAGEALFNTENTKSAAAPTMIKALVYGSAGSSGYVRDFSNIVLDALTGVEQYFGAESEERVMEAKSATILYNTVKTLANVYINSSIDDMKYVMYPVGTGSQLGFNVVYPESTKTMTVLNPEVISLFKHYFEGGTGYDEFMQNDRRKHLVDVMANAFGQYKTHQSGTNIRDYKITDELLEGYKLISNHLVSPTEDTAQQLYEKNELVNEAIKISAMSGFADLELTYGYEKLKYHLGKKFSTEVDDMVRTLGAEGNIISYFRDSAAQGEKSYSDISSVILKSYNRQFVLGSAANFIGTALQLAKYNGSKEFLPIREHQYNVLVHNYPAYKALSNDLIAIPNISADAATFLKTMQHRLLEVASDQDDRASKRKIINTYNDYLYQQSIHNSAFRKYMNYGF